MYTQATHNCMIRNTQTHRKQESERHKKKTVLTDLSSTHEEVINQRGFRSYSCACCGEFLAVLREKLTYYPKRKSDGSFVITKNERHVRKSRWNRNKKRTRIRRDTSNKIETQNRLTCCSCGIFVAYTSPSRPSHTYILDEALTDDPSSILARLRKLDEEKEKIRIPKSIRVDDDSVLLVVRIASYDASTSRSRVIRIDDDAIAMSLCLPSDAGESKSNLAIKLYFRDLFPELGVSLNFGDTNDTVHVSLRGGVSLTPEVVARHLFSLI